MDMRRLCLRAADRTAEKVGFDPTIILPIITIIIDFIKKCKEPKDPVEAKTMVSKEINSAGYRNQKVPVLLRRKLKQNGVASENMFAYYSSCLEEIDSHEPANLAACFS